MRLETLTIINFRVLKEAHLSFSDQVIGIIGPNGAGKSSIVEAISWALYGTKVARSGKDEIRSTYAAAGEECRVDLGFELNGEHYLLTRRLIGRQDRIEVTLSRNGRPLSGNGVLNGNRTFPRAYGDAHHQAHVEGLPDAQYSSRFFYVLPALPLHIRFFLIEPNYPTPKNWEEFMDRPHHSNSDPRNTDSSPNRRRRA